MRAPIPEPERWGEDPKLDALLGAQGAAALRAMLDGFPEPRPLSAEGGGSAFRFTLPR